MYLFVLVIIFLTTCFGSPLFAKEAENLTYIEGSVVKIKSNKIILSLEDVATARLRRQTFYVNTSTKFPHQKLDKIQQSDLVIIGYVIENGKQVAKIIYLEKDFVDLSEQNKFVKTGLF